LLDILLPFLLKLFKLSVILKGRLFEVATFHAEGGLQLVDFASVEFLEAGNFVLEPLVFDDDVLVLVQEVVDFEL
jgi:hypothetical protein